MQSTSPIRRYVLLRQRDGATASRWSMERIGSAPRSGAIAPAGAQSAKSAGSRV